MRLWKVGELARQTGLTVRTLHHYDAIGLLAPSHRTDSGHRLYTAGDVARLQRVLSLRDLGFALEEVRDALDRPGFSAREVIRLHLARLREEIARREDLCRRLEGIDAGLASAGEVSAEEFIRAIEAMTMFEKYYTPEQLEELRRRKEALGEEAIRKAQEEWAEVFAGMRREMANGTDPASEPALRYARKARELVNAFTGGNQEIEKSLENMYRQEPDIAAGYGFPHDPAFAEYYGKAMAALKEKG